MKTRNRGEEFVGNRLRPLAERVAHRTAGQVEAGLTGTVVVDELGKDDVDSRTATGLTMPGPTDNAVAWCALWGLSQFPVIAQVTRASRTAGHLPAKPRAAHERRGSLYVPVPIRPIGLARLRSIVLSGQLAVAASPNDQEGDLLDVEAARAWLADRGIGAIVRFPIGEYGSASAPERRALLGRVVPMDRF
jgi:CRISPR-associated protein Csb3